MICCVIILAHVSLQAQEYKKVYFFDSIIFEPIFQLAQKHDSINKLQYLAWQNKKINTITVPLRISNIEENLQEPNYNKIITFSIEGFNFVIKTKDNYIIELVRENKKESSTEYYRRNFDSIEKLKTFSNSWGKKSIEILLQIYANQDIMFLFGKTKPGDIINIEVRAYRQEQKLIIIALKFSSSKYIKELSIYNKVLQGGYLIEPTLLGKQTIGKSIAGVNTFPYSGYPNKFSIHLDKNNLYTCSFFSEGGLKNFVAAKNKKWAKQILWDSKGTVVGEMNYPHEEDRSPTPRPRKPALLKEGSLKNVSPWQPAKPQQNGLNIQEKSPDFNNFKKLSASEALWLVKHIDENFYYPILMRELFFRLNILDAEKQNILYHIDREIITTPVGSKRWGTLRMLDAYGRRYCSNVQSAANSYAEILKYKREFQKYPYLCFQIMADIDFASNSDAGIDASMNPLLALYALQHGKMLKLQKREALMRLWLPIYLTTPDLSPEENPGQIHIYPISGWEMFKLYKELDPQYIKSFNYLYRTVMVGDDTSLKTVRADLALKHQDFSHQSERIRRNIYLALASAGNIESRQKWYQIAMDKAGAGYSPLLKLYWRQYKTTCLYSEQIAKVEKNLQKHPLDITTRKKIDKLFSIYHSPYLVKKELGKDVADQPVVEEYINLLVLKIGQGKANTGLKYKELFDKTLKKALSDYSYPSDIIKMYLFIATELQNCEQATQYLKGFINLTKDPDIDRIAAIYALYRTEISEEDKISLLKKIDLKKYDLGKLNITSLQAAFLKKQQEQHSKQ